MKYDLAITGISSFSDIDIKIVVLGPWCLTPKENKKLLEGKDYLMIDSPWKPSYKIKEAGDYCHQAYENCFLSCPKA